MPKLAEGNVQVTAVVSEEMVDWLDNVAAQHRHSRSWLIAHALEHYRLAANKTGSIQDPDALSYELARQLQN